MGGVCRHSGSSGQSQARAARCSEIGQLSPRSCRKLEWRSGICSRRSMRLIRKANNSTHDAEVADNLRNLIDRVQLESGGIRVSLNLKRLIADPIETRDAANLTMTRFVPLEMKRRGVEIRLVIEGESAPAARPDPHLLKAVARGHRWFAELASGKSASIKEIARREGVYDSYVKRLIPLAFLAPELVRSICNGSQPIGIAPLPSPHTRGSVCMIVPE